jgi:protein-disulfide isomerase
MITAENLTLPDPDRDHINGAAEAPIALLEYGDFECPACGMAHPVVKASQEQLGDSLCFAFRNFPLTTVHPHSEHAAEAAEAGGAQGNFWEMHDTLFENQNALDDQSLFEYAAALELDAERLIREVRNQTYQPRVREDFKAGVRAGVNGTPTFFINGARYDGPRDFESFFEALTGAARSANGISNATI